MLFFGSEEKWHFFFSFLVGGVALLASGEGIEAPGGEWAVLEY